MKKTLSVILLLLMVGPLTAQEGVNVLFVGNSYTEVNNLPLMVQQVAESMGDRLSWQSNTPGGCTFSQHCSNRSMQLICSGGWDFVVLQEQSQLPSFPQGQVETEVFPYAERLVDSVYAHNPCCEPMFYMTWGRKNGDDRNATYFPVLGTYEGMDSMLCERYTFMAQQYDASLCPVGRVWRYLRTHHADIELYQADESHPSVAGTYAAACAFYVMFFHRDPDSIAFDASLPAATAQTIRAAVHQVVYADLAGWRRPQPQPAFSVERIDNSTLLFTSATQHADSLWWQFGDGSDTTTAVGQSAVTHRYGMSGTFTVTLTAMRHCLAESMSVEVTVTHDSTAVAVPEVGSGEPFEVYPNPASQVLHIVSANVSGGWGAALYALDGRMLLRRSSPSGGRVDLPVDALPAGEYILRCTTPAGVYVRKVVVAE